MQSSKGVEDDSHMRRRLLDGNGSDIEHQRRYVKYRNSVLAKMEARHAFITREAEREAPDVTQMHQSSRPSSVDLIDLRSKSDQDASDSPARGLDEVTHHTAATLDLPAHTRARLYRKKTRQCTYYARGEDCWSKEGCTFAHVVGEDAIGILDELRANRPCPMVHVNDNERENCTFQHGDIMYIRRERYARLQSQTSYFEDHTIPSILLLGSFRNTRQCERYVTGLPCLFSNCAHAHDKGDDACAILGELKSYRPCPFKHLDRKRLRTCNFWHDQRLFKAPVERTETAALCATQQESGIDMLSKRPTVSVLCGLFVVVVLLAIFRFQS